MSVQFRWGSRGYKINIFKNKNHPFLIIQTKWSFGLPLGNDPQYSAEHVWKKETRSAYCLPSEEEKTTQQCK